MSQDELATDSLEVPVFHLSPESPISEESTPAAVLSFMLTEDVMAELCQKVTPEQTHSIFLEKFELRDTQQLWQSDLADLDYAQLHIQIGPSLAVMVVTASGQEFVSPWLEFAPEFDLGLDDEIDDKE